MFHLFHHLCAVIGFISLQVQGICASTSNSAAFQRQGVAIPVIITGEISTLRLASVTLKILFACYLFYTLGSSELQFKGRKTLHQRVLPIDIAAELIESVFFSPLINVFCADIFIFCFLCKILRLEERL